MLFGLLSAGGFGTSDFLGGLISRRYPSYTVVFTSQVGGTIAYILLVVLTHEALPAPQYLLFGMMGAVSGVIGINLLYRSLASGTMSLVAPISAIVATIIPVIWSILQQGSPSLVRWAGFLLALVAVWLISSSGSLREVQWQAIRQPALAGLCFGITFTFISEATKVSLFWPLIALRVTSLPIVLAACWVSGVPAFVRPRDLPLTMMSGVLDAIANATFAVAAQLGRLDVASVLSSLYPAGTVFLAALVLRERIQRHQWIGMGLALVAVVLITFEFN